MSGRRGRERAGSPFEIAVVGLLLAGAFLLPLVFSTASEDVFALPKTLAMLALSIPLGISLGAAFFKGTRLAVRSSRAIAGALVAYVVLVGIAMLLSADPEHSLVGERLQYQGFLATLAYALAMVAAWATITTRRRARWLMLAAAAASAVVVAYGLAQAAGLDPIWDVLDKGRIFSTLGQANALAAYLVIVLPMSLALVMTSDGWWRIALVVLSLGIVLTLVLTLSRGGYLGGVAGLVVVAALTVRLSGVTRGRLALLGLVVIIGVAVALLPPVSATARRVVNRIGSMADVTRGSAASHLDLWAVGLTMAAEHPLFGIGPEMFPVEFPRYRDRVLPADSAARLARYRPESPHSVPIGLAAGAGLPALAAYLVLVVGVIVSGWRRALVMSGRARILAAGLLGAAVGHLVTDLFMTPEVSTSWMWWVVLGVIAALPFRAVRVPGDGSDPGGSDPGGIDPRASHPGRRTSGARRGRRRRWGAGGGSRGTGGRIPSQDARAPVSAQNGTDDAQALRAE